MAADTPWARVVIVNYNAGPLLQLCVDALAAQTLDAFEAVIVDNASTAPPVSDLELPDARFSVKAAGGNLGFAAASNLGAEGAACSWLAMLNPDTRPKADWLAELRAATIRYPWGCAFGSTQVSAADPQIVDGFGDSFSAFGAAWRNLGGEPVSQLPDADCDIFSPCAAAALYATDAFEAAGGFDENFFCFLEDVDLGFRLRLMGGQCVQVRRAEVLHEGSAITGHMSDFSVYHSYRNRLWLMAKTIPWPLLPAVVPAQAAAIAFNLVRRPAPFRRAALRGLRDSFDGLADAIAERREIQRKRTVSAAEVARTIVWNPFGRQSRRPQELPQDT